MPSRYRHDYARLKAEIVARVLAGETQRAVCAAPGMPGPHAVRKWALADAAFAAALADARRRGRWVKSCAYDEAVAERFLAALRAGAAVRDLYGRPGMPSRRTVAYWRATQAPFAEALWALWGPGGSRGPNARAVALAALGRGRRRAFDAAVADRLIVALNRHGGTMRLEEVLASEAAFPSRPVLTRWRRERPAFDRVLRAMFAGWRAKRARDWRVPEQVVEALADEITFGASFASLGREGGPSRATLRRWYRRDEAFAEQVDRACDTREMFLSDQMLQRLDQGGFATVREMQAALAPWSRAIARLRHRPGAAHGARGGRADEG